MQLSPADSYRLDVNIVLKYCFHSAYTRPPCGRHFVVKGLKVKLYLYDSVSLKLRLHNSFKLAFLFIPNIFGGLYTCSYSK